MVAQKPFQRKSLLNSFSVNLLLAAALAFFQGPWFALFPAGLLGLTALSVALSRRGWRSGRGGHLAPPLAAAGVKERTVRPSLENAFELASYDEGTGTVSVDPHLPEFFQRWYYHHERNHEQVQDLFGRRVPLLEEFLVTTLDVFALAAALWPDRGIPAAVEHVQEGSWVGHDQWMRSDLGHLRMARLGLVGPQELEFLAPREEFGDIRYSGLIEVREGMPLFIFYELPDTGPADRRLLWLTLDEVRALAPKRPVAAGPAAEMPEDLAKSVRSAIFLEARAITMRQTAGRPFSGFDRDLDEGAARMTRNGDIERGANGLVWSYGWKLKGYMQELLEGRTLAGASVMSGDRERLQAVFGAAGRDHQKAYDEAMRIMGTHAKFVALAYILAEAFPTSNKGPRPYRSTAPSKTLSERIGTFFHEAGHAAAGLLVGVRVRPEPSARGSVAVKSIGRVGRWRDAWITLGGILPIVPLLITGLMVWLVPHLIALAHGDWRIWWSASAALWGILVFRPAFKNLVDNWSDRRLPSNDFRRLRLLLAGARPGDVVDHEEWFMAGGPQDRLLRRGLVPEPDLSHLQPGATFGPLNYHGVVRVGDDGLPNFLFYNAGPERGWDWLTLEAVSRKHLVRPRTFPEDRIEELLRRIGMFAADIYSGSAVRGERPPSFDALIGPLVNRLGAGAVAVTEVDRIRTKIESQVVELLSPQDKTLTEEDRYTVMYVFSRADDDPEAALAIAGAIRNTYAQFVMLLHVLAKVRGPVVPTVYHSIGSSGRFFSRLGVAYHELSHALAALSVGVLQRPDLRDGHARSVAWLGRRIGPARDAWITLGGIVPFVPLAMTASAGWLMPRLLAMIYEQSGALAAAAVLVAALAAWTLLVALPAWLNARESWKTRYHRFSDYTRLRKDLRILRRPKGVVWEPADGGFSADNTNVGRLMKRLGLDSYEKLLEFSQKSPELFWSAAAGPKGDLGLEWYQPYREAHDEVVADETRWFVGGRINLYHNAVEKHVRGGAAYQEAVVWRGEDGGRRRMTYGELHEQAGRAAASFARLGVGQGTTVGLVMSPSPESVAAMLALWKLGAVACPIFAAFGAPLIAERLKEAGAEVVVTVDGVLHNGKVSTSPGASGADVPLGKDMVDEALASVPSVKRVVVLRRLTEAQRPASGVPMERGRDLWWDDFISAAAGDPVPETARTPADAPAIYHYSSGTTGAPKGLVHTHGGLSANVVKELAYHFDVKPGDRFAGWDEAGWMMGPWKIIGVLSQGATVVMLEGSPTRPKNRIWSVLEEEGVTHFGLSPNLIRSMAADPDVLADVRRRRFADLRVLGSTGSPWDETSWTWLFEKVGRRKTPIINISGGTDLYGALLANSPLTPMKPMTMWPALGMRIEAVDDEGEPVPDGTPGTLVWKGPFGPSQTRGLVNDPSGERFHKAYFAKFRGLWDHGDRVVRAGRFWQVLGRAGDSYKHNGKWVSSGEVENAVLTHPAVREAVNIGVPNPQTDNDLVVFAVLKDGVEPADALAGEIGQSVAKHLGKTFPVKAVHFLPALPKTQSQKSMHRLLRDAYLGNPLGDASAMQPETAGVLETARFLGAGARGAKAPEAPQPPSRLRLKFAASYAVVGIAAVAAFYLGMFTTGSVPLKIATFTVFTGITDLMGQWMSLKPGRAIRWKQVLLAVFPIGPLMGAITVYGFPLSGAAAGWLMPYLAFALPGIWNFLLVSVVGFILFGAVNDLFDQWLASRKGKPFRWRRLAAAALQEGPAMGLIAWASLVLIGLVVPFGGAWMSVAGQMFGTVLFMFFVRARTIIYSTFVQKVRLSDPSYGEEDRAEAEESAEKQTEAFWVARHLSVLKNFFTFGNAVIEGIFNQLFQLFYTWGTNKDGFLVKEEKLRRNRVYLMLYPLILAGRAAGAALRRLRPGPSSMEGGPWHSLTEEQIRLMDEADKVQSSAEVIKSVFDSYLLQFRKSAGLARLAFEKTDKSLFQKTDRERAALYKTSVDKAVQIVGQILKDEVKDPARWAAVQKEFDRRVSGRFEIDIAETFYRSVHTRFFPDTVTDVETFRQEFVAEDAVPDPTPIYKTIPFRGDDMRRQVERVLSEFPVNVRYKNRREDARQAARRIDAALASLPAAGKPVSFELARKLFYRGRAAYIVGRVRFEDGRHAPIVFNILNTGEGAVIRAVFVGEDAVSPIFSFTRSSFHVDTDRYHDLAVFLKETMPKKKESIFYFSLGFDDHAETKQLEGIAKKLRAAREAGEKLGMAAGRPGGAMTVFTMPNLDLVFKVIRDRMAYGKERTRSEVRGAHQLVHQIDRLGRMVDTLTFKNLRFPADVFEPRFLEVLKQNVPDSVRYEDAAVTFSEIFTQRKTIPLPVYFDMHKNDREKCLKVVSDLGYLLRELAMSNIYMGDFHMSNFGVMDSGRVVLYDFDEMEPLTSDRVSIKDLPDWIRRYSEENGDGEPGMWPHMAPEELRMFLIPNDYYREFDQEHGLLLSDKWWNEVRDRLKAEHRIDFEPRYLRPYLLHPIEDAADAPPRAGAYHQIAGSTLVPFGGLLERALRAAGIAMHREEKGPSEPEAPDVTGKAAWRIAEAFESMLELYRTASRQAEAAFKGAKGDDFHKADIARRDSYERFLSDKVGEVRSLLGETLREPGELEKLKAAFEGTIRRHPQRQLAGLFYMDIARRLSGEAFPLSDLQRLSPELPAFQERPAASLTRSIAVRGDLGRALGSIARDLSAGAEFADLDADLVSALEYMRGEIGDPSDITDIDFVAQPLFRGNHAYLLARLRGPARTVPLMLSIENGPQGAGIRYVYLGDEIGELFSYTRSSLYFPAEAYDELVDFIHSLAPGKRIATLYFALGFPELASAEALREVAENARAAAAGGDRFAFSDGKEGALLISFDRPDLGYVLKVLRDQEHFGKGEGQLTKEQIRRQYDFVHRAHRFTRLLDNMEYENVAFPRGAFPEDLLAKLLEKAGESVKAEGDQVVFKHLLVQRKVTPLSIVIRENGRRDAFRPAELDLALLKAMLAGKVPAGSPLQEAVLAAIRGGKDASEVESMDEERIFRDVQSALFGGLGSPLWKALRALKGWSSIAEADAGALGLSGEPKRLLERAAAGEDLEYAPGVWSEYAALNRAVFQAVFPEAAAESLKFDASLGERQRQLEKLAVDIGHLIKELAYSGLFYDDLNRHNLGLLAGRMVIFDLDGFEKLVDARLPDNFSAEALFSDTDGIGLPTAFLEPMRKAHPELFRREWWEDIIAKLRADADGKLDFVPAVKLDNQLPEHGPKGPRERDRPSGPGAPEAKAGQGPARDAGPAARLEFLLERIRLADLNVIDRWTRQAFLEAFDVVSRLFVKPLLPEEAGRIRDAVAQFAFADHEQLRQPGALALPELHVTGRVRFKGLSADKTKAVFILKTENGRVEVKVQAAKGLPFGTLFADDGTHVAATIQGPPVEGTLYERIWGAGLARLFRRPVGEYTITLQPDTLENPALLYRALVEDFNEVKAMAEGLRPELAHDKFHGDLASRPNFAFDESRQTTLRDYSAWLPPVAPVLAQRFGAADAGEFRAEQLRKNVSLLAALALNGAKGGYAGLGSSRAEMDAFVDHLQRVSLRNLPRDAEGRADEELFRRAVGALKRAGAEFERRYQEDPQALRREYAGRAAGVAMALGAANDISPTFGGVAEDWLVRDLLAARDLLFAEKSTGEHFDAAKALVALGARLRRRESAVSEKAAALNLGDLRGGVARNADYVALIGAGVGRVRLLEDGTEAADLTVLIGDEDGPAALRSRLEALLKDASGSAVDGVRRLLESLDDRSKVLVLSPRDLKAVLREGNVVDVARLLERPGLEAWKTGDRPIRIQTADPSLWWTGGLPETRQAVVEFLLWVTKDAFFRARKGDIEEYLKAVQTLDIQA